MDIYLFAALSFLIIMVWHFAMSSQPNNFDLFLMIGFFLIGGLIGWHMDSIELALAFSIGSSLLFIH